jgi:penicillin-binding protein 2
MGLTFLQGKTKVEKFQRIRIFLYFFYCLTFIIALRFFYLQILRGHYYEFKAQGNTERAYINVPPRGLIYDRNGIVIASNKDAYSLSMIWAFAPKNGNLRKQIFKDLSTHLQLDAKYLEKKYLENRKDYRQFLLKESLSIDELIYLREHKFRFPFLSIVEYSGRVYPYKEAISHILGYIGSINKSEYEKLKNKGYRPDSIIGKTGIEKEYDSILRGEEGQSVSIVDAVGRDIQVLNNRFIKSIPGKNLVLSIDSNVQEIAHAALEGREGAVIVTKVATGEVIALESSPGFDANKFLNSNDKLSFNEYLQNSSKPFINRAIQGQYAPGSLFKIVTAISALEDGKVDPYKMENVSAGFFKLGDHVFGAHAKHKALNLPLALAKSDNLYFYKLGYQLGYASLLEHAIDLGLKNKTGIDLPNETSSFIPSPEWKERRFGTIWMRGDTVNIAIGQGFLLLSPIGVHNIVSVLSTGHLIRPRIVWQIKNPYSGFVEKSFKPEFISSYSPSERTLNVIREGLSQTTSIGTAVYHKYLSSILIAGKTGTAQTSRKKDNAWFISYGPLDKPIEEQYGITVVVEYSGFGGSYSVPISSILYNYLEQKQTKEQAIAILNRILPKQSNIRQED